MTFLTTRYPLAKSLTPKDLERLRGLTTQYGIHGVSIRKNNLLIEYDASRLHESGVLARVRRAGIDVRPEREIPAGALDHTGEFKDFAWPTTGITPANQPQK